MAKGRTLKKPNKRTMAKPMVLYPVCANESERMDMIQRVVGHLNSCVDATTNKIPYNCKPAWQPTINSFTSENWVDLMAPMEDLYHYSPYVNEDQYKILLDAAYLIHEYPNHARVLNEGKYKTTAWRALMTIREIHNSITGWKPGPDHKGPPNVFSSLFN